nr:WhiB family transcriptional regulator [Micromonospora sonchi]
MRPRDWRDDAVCRDEDPGLFWPIGSSGPALAQAEQAKDVCRRCPAFSKNGCLNYAIEAGIDDGIFGGMDADERRAHKASPTEVAA